MALNAPMTNLARFVSGILAPCVREGVYVVGGAVRNHVLNVPIKDLDLVVDVDVAGVNSGDVAAIIAQHVEGSNVTVNQYGVAILTLGALTVDGISLDGEILEIANTRKESYGGEAGKGYKPSSVQSATIREDLYRREFTFNTLLWRVNDLGNGFANAPILDLTGFGLADLHARIMRCPSDPCVTFTDDPTRMLRAIKFALKYGFTVETETLAAIRKCAPSLHNAPHNAISTLLVNNVFDNVDNIPTALAMLAELGLLDHVVKMARDHKAMNSTLASWANDLPFKAWFALVSAGFAWDSRLSFLSESQVTRFRALSEKVDTRPLFADLKQPGRVFNMQALISERGLHGSQIRELTKELQERILSSWEGEAP